MPSLPRGGLPYVSVFPVIRAAVIVMGRPCAAVALIVSLRGSTGCPVLVIDGRSRRVLPTEGPFVIRRVRPVAVARCQALPESTKHGSLQRGLPAAARTFATPPRQQERKESCNLLRA